MLPSINYVKNDILQVSNDWGRETLSEEQVRYASEDAYLSLLLYNAVKARMV